MKKILKRSISGFIYSLLVFICTTDYFSKFLYSSFGVNIPSRYTFFCLIVFFFFGCLYELTKILKFKSIFFRVLCFLLSIIVLYMYSDEFFSNDRNLLYAYFQSDWKYFIKYCVFIFVLFLFAVTILFRFPEELELDRGKIIFSVVYVGVPFSVSLVLPTFIQPLSPEVFFIFLLIWVSDSFSYIVGTKFGKTILFPKISPNKTLEGFMGGIVGTIFVGGIIHYYFFYLKGNWYLIGGLISIFAPMGDLVESKLKRIYNVKDSGNFMPGHGGFLDRLDSYILCSIVIFVYYSLIAIL